MSENRDPLLLDHDADGIQELDNNLPRWWVWLFYLTIAFAVIYLGYYHVLRLGTLSAAEYQKEWKAGETIKAAALTRFEAALPTLTPSKDPAMLAEGKGIFLKNCSPCHRKDGGGLVGPNLCDEYWIHGSNFVDNLRVIVNGVPAKGMLTWKGVLKPKEIHEVASYIYTLRGTHPPNPKPPENQAQPEQPNAYE
ncbi:MAG: cbb3-type cytochrome c oxidase N-terminal domain-containing protein [Tepidisphaeraceae bacterium]|jgi:cytochrome c oxidase cbb3-type subunit 3